MLTGWCTAEILKTGLTFWAKALHQMPSVILRFSLTKALRQMPFVILCFSLTNALCHFIFLSNEGPWLETLDLFYFKIASVSSHIQT